MVSFKSILVSSLLVRAVSCSPVAGHPPIVRPSAMLGPPIMAGPHPIAGPHQSPTPTPSGTPPDTPPDTPSGKRGLAYNNPKLLSAFFQTGGPFSWSYNWASRPGGNSPNVEFVPMLWGPRAFGSWQSDASASLAAGSAHLLAFNEPDIAEQANMSPQAAAEAYQMYMNPFAGKAKLGSPAVSNGGPPLGLTWMANFLTACGGKCHIDFLVIHWYNGAWLVEDFKNHVSAAIALAMQYGIDKVWITEFGAHGDEGAQAQFLKEVLPWLDSNPGVERYAYFFVDQLVRGDSLSLVGKAFSAV
ncbi:hypothetical protein ACJ72_00864 [Emergomyces africanus]|uniref:Asl1-like glycosyl hydrolase catalytic domain-containing protein n=1 Tax=Emergomyces africanus TaxID=1955775 RepID=A0A1B7P6U4_9EURO|nr:hypothetical protein ACJ72_00864 [Emergomyces africanus]